MIRPNRGARIDRGKSLTTKFRGLFQVRYVGALGGALVLGILGGAFLYHNSLQSKLVNPSAPADPSLSSLVSAAPTTQPQSALMSAGNATNTAGQDSPQTEASSSTSLQGPEQSRPVNSPQLTLQSSVVPDGVKQSVNKIAKPVCTTVDKTQKLLIGSIVIPTTVCNYL